MGRGGRLTGRSDPLGRRLEYTDNPRKSEIDRGATQPTAEGWSWALGRGCTAAVRCVSVDPVLSGCVV